MGGKKESGQSGVVDPKDYAIFTNFGYKALYGGLSMQDIHARKGLKKSQKILDHMGSSELAANLFRATQTEEKLRREHVRGKSAANHLAAAKLPPPPPTRPAVAPPPHRPPPSTPPPTPRPPVYQGPPTERLGDDDMSF